MTPTERLALATEARASVARVIELLERPTVVALDLSAVELSAATERIQQLRADGTGGGSSLKSLVGGLRKDLRRAGLLLRHAWEFRSGLGEPQPGYTQKGELMSQAAPLGHWTLEG